MKLNELVENLHILNESELFYKKYHSIKNHPDQLAPFLEAIDPEFLDKNYLVIPDNNDYSISYYREEMFFIEDQSQDIIVLKHNCYSPPTPHKHSFFEMLYVLEGTCDHCVNEQHFKMKAGEICIVSPEIMHNLSVFDDSIIINFLIRSSTFEEIFFSLLKGDNSTFPTQITEHCLNKYWLGCHPVVNFTFQYFCDIG